MFGAGGLIIILVVGLWFLGNRWGKQAFEANTYEDVRNAKMKKRALRIIGGIVGVLIIVLIFYSMISYKL